MTDAASQSPIASLTPLWRFADLVSATDAVRSSDAASVSPDVTGVSIDTRSLQPGDLFVALKDQRDGHDFVTAAFAKGAAAALVSVDYIAADSDGALLRVADPLKALEAIGRVARNRLRPTARVIAVTGSAGKTGTKEMLRACCGALGRVHASEKSYNNHWGVPLTLARMSADTEFAIFEIGMNHADEIRPLTGMVRPDVAIITTVEAVHLENFANVEAIADAKAEIFEGLVPGGTAIINGDNRFGSRLQAAAEAQGANVETFGFGDDCTVKGSDLELTEVGSRFQARTPSGDIAVRLAMPGRHIASNALGVVAALGAAGCDVAKGIAALATLAPPPGRGARSLLAIAGGKLLVVDESYNANPASMRAALATLGAVSRQSWPRRIAVIGDMLELGPDSAALHAGLKNAVEAAGVDVVFTCGPLSKGLYDALPPGLKGGYAGQAKELEGPLLQALRAGDVVMLKASNGTRLGVLVEALQKQFAPAPLT